MGNPNPILDWWHYHNITLWLHWCDNSYDRQSTLNYMLLSSLTAWCLLHFHEVRNWPFQYHPTQTWLCRILMECSVNPRALNTCCIFQLHKYSVLMSFMSNDILCTCRAYYHDSKGLAYNVDVLSSSPIDFFLLINYSSSHIYVTSIFYLDLTCPNTYNCNHTAVKTIILFLQC